MKKTKSPRREFIKLSAATVGGLAFPSKPDTGGSLPGSSVVEKKLKVVCVGAHPGDPEFGCGGTMARYSNAGHTVTFLYVTKGEASDPAKSHNEMAALRTKEAGNSCFILKAKPLFVGQIDGESVLDRSRNTQFDKMLNNEVPDIVFTHWPVDAHPDHQVAGLLALTAWVNANRKFHLYFYEVNTGVETMAFTPSDYVDITDVRDQKKEAMFAHKTQDPINTYNKYFEPLEIFRGLEAGVSAAEGFIHFKHALSEGMPGL